MSHEDVVESIALQMEAMPPEVLFGSLRRITTILKQITEEIQAAKDGDQELWVAGVPGPLSDTEKETGVRIFAAAELIAIANLVLAQPDGSVDDRAKVGAMAAGNFLSDTYVEALLAQPPRDPESERN